MERAFDQGRSLLRVSRATSKKEVLTKEGLMGLREGIHGRGFSSRLESPPRGNRQDFTKERELGGPCSKGSFCHFRRDPPNLIEDLPLPDRSHPKVDIAFSLSHPDFNRLSGNGGGGKDPNPDLSPTFHLTGHCPTTGFYLTGSHPTPFDSLQPKGPSKEVIVLGPLDPTLSGLTVLDLFRTEHTG
jgi:hypothetical protein